VVTVTAAIVLILLFFQGHDKDISVIQVSKSGKYIASGQQTHMGFQVSGISNLNAAISVTIFELSG
jgi:hypothetical protein